MADQQTTISIERGDVIRFLYRNWRGELAERQVVVAGLEWGATEWHPEPGWLMPAYDDERKEHRVFAMKDMSEIRYAG